MSQYSSIPFYILMGNPTIKCEAFQSVFASAMEPIKCFAAVLRVNGAPHAYPGVCDVLLNHHAVQHDTVLQITARDLLHLRVALDVDLQQRRNSVERAVYEASHAITRASLRPCSSTVTRRTAVSAMSQMRSPYRAEYLVPMHDRMSAIMADLSDVSTCA